jgi:hypothetical protein
MGEIAPSDERVHLASTTKDGRDKEEDEVKISLIAVLQKEVGCRLQQTKAVKVAVANGDLLEVNAWCKGLCWTALGLELTTDFMVMPLGEYGAVLGIQWLGANHMGFPTLLLEEILKLLKKLDSQSVVLSYNKIQFVWTR